VRSYLTVGAIGLMLVAIHLLGSVGQCEKCERFSSWLLEMIDKQARKELAALLRHLAAGQISNDQFEDRLPGMGDPAVRQVFAEGAWFLYDDLHEHRLIGKHRLEPVSRKELARWILFLESELPYEWPIITGWIRLLLIPVHLLTLGVTTAAVQRYVRRGGDVDVWPFRRLEGYRMALNQPPYLNG
jgi:hypothetical protein